jgi:hypothetical protein
MVFFAFLLWTGNEIRKGLRWWTICGMLFSVCDTDILLINLRKALLSCVSRLNKLALEDD